MKDVFCANEQLVTSHEASLSPDGEIILTCQSEGCGRFVKIPAGLDKAAINEYLAKHEEANKGQVNIEAQEAKLAELLAPDEPEE